MENEPVGAVWTHHFATRIGGRPRAGSRIIRGVAPDLGGSWHGAKIDAMSIVAVSARRPRDRDGAARRWASTKSVLVLVDGPSNGDPNDQVTCVD